MHAITMVFIIAGFLGGACLALLATHWSPGSLPNTILLNLGSALVSTGLISLILDLFWSKERARAEKAELKPFYDKFQQFANQLEKLEGRLEAFKKLGLNFCHSSRSGALNRFLGYAREIISPENSDTEKKINYKSPQKTINIVSSSARGLMGYLDREPHEVQKEWRELITTHPCQFHVLLTHPAYAHLRQPAEERSSGDIELEILKTAIYLNCVAGMGRDQLRFYRGSPTVFAIEVDRHILLNPYPYGKMAMETLCLEFESESESSYVSDFVGMHFNHTWAFIDQPSKLVDGKPLVVGVDAFEDIIAAFAECTYLGEPGRLRLTSAQVFELDTFTSKVIPSQGRNLIKKPPSETPFKDYIEKKSLTCSGQTEISCYISNSNNREISNNVA